MAGPGSDKDLPSFAFWKESVTGIRKRFLLENSKVQFVFRYVQNSYNVIMELLLGLQYQMRIKDCSHFHWNHMLPTHILAELS